MLVTSLRIALKALGRHKLRTALTMLGMMIGVAAVITMVALGTGAQETVSDDVQSAGTNLVTVKAGNYTRGGAELGIAQGLGASTTLTADDAHAIAEIPGVRYYAPEVRLRGWVANAESPAGQVDVRSPNESSTDHDIALEGNGVSEKGEVVKNGGVSEFSVDLQPGEYTFYCSVPGHREGGMEGTLTVK